MGAGLGPHCRYAFPLDPASQARDQRQVPKPPASHGPTNSSRAGIGLPFTRENDREDHKVQGLPRLRVAGVPTTFSPCSLSANHLLSCHHYPSQNLTGHPHNGIIANASLCFPSLGARMASISCPKRCNTSCRLQLGCIISWWQSTTFIVMHDEFLQ